MEQKSYYAVIPAYVRYDKDLSPNSKLLYGEITALCNEKGYCWATNQYFMDLYSLSERTIQNLLKQLVNKKYIKIIIDNNTKRRIFLLDTPAKNYGVGMQKNAGSPANNCTHNNKKNNKINNTDNNTRELPEDYDWLNE